MKKLFSYTFDIIVCCTLVVSLLLNIANKDKYDALNNAYNEITLRLENTVRENETLKSDIDKLSNTNKALLENLESSNTKSAIELPDFSIPSDCIGFLYIPSCDIQAYIRYGSSLDVISDMHVGEFECAQEIGVGNYSLLGHSNETKQYVFSSLQPNIKIGDDIFVVKNNKTYRFEVDGRAVVDANDVWVLEKSVSPRLTIVCCTNNGTQRFVVSAILI